MAVVDATRRNRALFIGKTTDTKPPAAPVGSLFVVSDTPALFIQTDDPENGVTNSGWVDVSAVASAGALSVGP